MEKLEFRLLKAEEIECRVGMNKNNGCSLLLYQDSRCGMDLLDETIGSLSWNRDHNFKDGKLYCKIGIWDDKKNQWVTKEDVGVESNTEEIKGQASDSFKRACVNWGIGRELYTAPFIWITLNENEINPNNKIKSDVKFFVSEIAYGTRRTIEKLVIKDRNGNVRYAFGKTNEKVIQPPKKSLEMPREDLLQNGELNFIAKDKELTNLMKELLSGETWSNSGNEKKLFITKKMRALFKEGGQVD